MSDAQEPKKILQIDNFAVVIIHYRVTPGRLKEVIDSINLKCKATLAHMRFARGHLDFGDIAPDGSSRHFPFEWKLIDEKNETYEPKFTFWHKFPFGNWGQYDLTLFLHTWLTGFEIKLLHQLANLDHVTNAQISLHMVPCENLTDTSTSSGIFSDKFGVSNNNFKDRYEYGEGTFNRFRPYGTLLMHGLNIEPDGGHKTLGKYKFFTLSRIKLDPIALMSYGTLFITSFLKSCNDNLKRVTHKDYIKDNSKKYNNGYLPIDEHIRQTDNIHNPNWTADFVVYPLISLSWNEITLLIGCNNMRYHRLILKYLRRVTVKQVMEKYACHDKLISKKDISLQIEWISSLFPDEDNNDSNFQNNTDLWIKSTCAVTKTLSTTLFDYYHVVRQTDQQLRKVFELFKGRKSIYKYSMKKRNNTYKDFEKLLGDYLHSPHVIMDHSTINDKLEKSLMELNKNIHSNREPINNAPRWGSGVNVRVRIAARPAHGSSLYEWFKRLKLLEEDGGLYDLACKTGTFDFVLMRYFGANESPEVFARTVWCLHILTGRRYFLPTAEYSRTDFNTDAGEILRLASVIDHQMKRPSDSQIGFNFDTDYSYAAFKQSQFIIHKEHCKKAQKILDHYEQYGMRASYANIIAIINERIHNPIYLAEYVEYLPMITLLTRSIIELDPNISEPVFGKELLVDLRSIANKLHNLEQVISTRFRSTYDHAEHGDTNSYSHAGGHTIVSIYQVITNHILEKYKKNLLLNLDNTGSIVLVHPQQSPKVASGLGVAITLNTQHIFQWSYLCLIYHEIFHYYINALMKDNKSSTKMGEMIKNIVKCIRNHEYYIYIDNDNVLNNNISDIIVNNYFINDKNQTTTNKNYRILYEHVIKEVLCDMFNYYVLYPTEGKEKEYALDLWMRNYYVYRRWTYNIVDDKRKKGASKYGKYKDILVMIIVYYSITNKEMKMSSEEKEKLEEKAIRSYHERMICIEEDIEEYEHVTPLLKALFGKRANVVKELFVNQHEDETGKSRSVFADAETSYKLYLYFEYITLHWGVQLRDVAREMKKNYNNKKTNIMSLERMTEDYTKGEVYRRTKEMDNDNLLQVIIALLANDDTCRVVYKSVEHGGEHAEVFIGLLSSLRYTSIVDNGKIKEYDYKNPYDIELEKVKERNLTYWKKRKQKIEEIEKKAKKDPNIVKNEKIMFDMTYNWEDEGKPYGNNKIYAKTTLMQNALRNKMAVLFQMWDFSLTRKRQFLKDLHEFNKLIEDVEKSEEEERATGE